MSQNPEAQQLVHICPRADWEAGLPGKPYQTGSLKEVGFIHCSRPEQVLGVANAFYRGQRDLVLLWIEPENVIPEIRWEAADGQAFPHIYGPLNREAVRAVSDFPPDEDGFFRRLPAPGRQENR